MRLCGVHMRLSDGGGALTRHWLPLARQTRRWIHTARCVRELLTGSIHANNAQILKATEVFDALLSSGRPASHSADTKTGDAQQ